MLRLSRDRLVIAFDTRQAVVARLAGWGGRVVTHCSIPTHGPAWSGALGEALQAPDFRALPVQVLLPAAWVRLGFSTPLDAFPGRQDETDLAWHTLSSQCPGAPENWKVNSSLQGPGAPLIAIAIERKRLDELTLACQSAQLKLTSARPYWQAVLARQRSQIAADATWLVVAEPGKLTTFALQRGRWIAGASATVEADSWERLGYRLTREAMSLGLAPGGKVVLIQTPGMAHPQIKSSHWQWQPITPSSTAPADSSQALLMAAGV